MLGPEHVRAALAVEGMLSPGWGLFSHPSHPHPLSRAELAAGFLRLRQQAGGVLLPFPDLTRQTLQRRSKQTGLVRPGQEVQNKGGLLLSAASFCQMINCESNYLKKKKRLEQKRNEIGYTLLWQIWAIHLFFIQWGCDYYVSGTWSRGWSRCTRHGSIRALVEEMSKKKPTGL